MQYKTLILEMLTDQTPRLYEQLRQERMMLAAVEMLARSLRARHETWKVKLLQQNLGLDSTQNASAALEIALQETQDHLQRAYPFPEWEVLSLDRAMAFLRKHMSDG